MRQYIGIPFKPHGRDLNGWDCYGLIYYIYGKDLGISLFSYVNDYATVNDKHIPDLIKQEKARWHEVVKPQKYDVVLLGKRGRHVGLMLNDSEFLHVLVGISTCVEGTKSAVWKNRIQGYCRHESRIDSCSITTPI